MVEIALSADASLCAWASKLTIAPVDIANTAINNVANVCFKEFFLRTLAVACIVVSRGCLNADASLGGKAFNARSPVNQSEEIRSSVLNSDTFYR
jgi:hypothetical protein